MNWRCRAIAAVLLGALAPLAAPAEGARGDEGSAARPWREAELRGLQAEARGDLEAAFAGYAEALKAACAAGEWVEAEVAVGRASYFASRLRAHAALAELLARAREGGAKGPPPPPLEARIRWQRAMAVLGQGDVEGARAETAPLGFIQRFFVIGPFDNERGGGFGTAYPPEQAIDLGAAADGKVRPVRWRFVERGAIFGKVDLDALLRPNDECLAYALAYVKSEEARRVAFRISSDEGWKLWVNGRLLGSREVNRQLEFDQDAVPGHLRKGWNAILLKVAERKGQWGFRLRVTDPEGAPAAGLTVAGEAEARGGLALGAEPAAGEGEPFPLALGAMDDLVRRAQAGPKDPLDAFHRGYLHYQRGAHDEDQHPDREAYAEAVALAPDLAWLRVFYALSLDQRGDMSVHREENRKRRELERAIELDPRCVAAHCILASYYLDSQRSVERAEPHADAAIAANPSCAEALVLKGRALERRGLDLLARRHLEGLKERGYPAFSPEALHALAEARLAAGERAGAIALYSEAIARDFLDQKARSKLAEICRDAGQLDRAAEVSAPLIALNPFGTSTHAFAASLLAARDQFAEAAREVEAAIEVAPEDDDLWEQLGRLRHRAGQKEAALEAFDRALALNPNKVKLARYVDFLRTRGSAYEAPFVADAGKLAEEARATPIDPSLSHRYLLKQQVVNVHRDGTKSAWEQLVARIENEDGQKEFDRYAIPYAAGEQKVRIEVAEVIHPDGTRDEARLGTSDWGSRGDDEAPTYLYETVDLPALKVGDVLHLQYKVEDLKQGFFGDYFGETFHFQDVVPVDLARFAVIHPAERSFFVHERGVAAKTPPSASPDGKTLTRAWEMRQVPKLEPEPNMPSAKEVAPAVQVSTFQDWNAFATWYWNLVRKQMDTSDELKAKLKEITGDATAEREVVRAIYNFVVTDVRYNDKWEFGVHGYKPYKASSILARRFGDCKDKATLIDTFLGEKGIKAYPVLIFGVGGEGRWEEDLSLPLMNHFNHCISYVAPAGGREGFFLDGTAQYHDADILPAMDYGAKVVVVTEAGAKIVTIPFPDPKENGVVERHKITVGEDGSATVDAELEAQGEFSVVLRSVFSNPADRPRILTQLYGRQFAGARAEADRWSDLKDLNAPVKAQFRIRIPRLLKKTSRGLALEEVKSLFYYVYAEKLSQLAPLAERRHDVILPVPKGMEQETTYVLPRGLKVEVVPPAASLETEFGTYRKVAEVKGGTVRIEKRIRMRAHRVPVARYGEFRQFVNDADRADEARVQVSGEPGQD